MTRLPRVPRFSREAREPRSTLWLVSFTDLISLLLAFFVMMYAMAEPEPQRWARMVEGLASARSTASTPSQAPAEPQAEHNALAVEEAWRVDRDYLGTLLRTQVADQPALAGVEVRTEDDRVTIAIPGAVLFEHGGLALGERGRRAVALLGAAVGRAGNRVEVVGHAEREDAASGHAWERALARAVAVANGLRETGYRRDLVARSLMAPPGLLGGRGPRVDLVVRGLEG